MKFSLYIFYSNLDEYWWIFNPNHGANNLVIEILDIDLEKAPNCKYDRLILYAGEHFIFMQIVVFPFSRGARDSKIGKKWPESSRILDYILS